MLYTYFSSNVDKSDMEKLSLKLSFKLAKMLLALQIHKFQNCLKLEIEYCYLHYSHDVSQPAVWLTHDKVSLKPIPGPAHHTL